MKTTKLYSISLVAIMVFTFSQQASAQVYTYYYQMFYNNLTNRIWEGILEKNSPGYAEAKKKWRESKSKSSNQTSTVSKSPNRTSTVPVKPSRMNNTFQFQSTGTRLTVQEYLDLVQVTPQEKVELKELIQELLNSYEAQDPAKSLPNDLALAVVSYIGIMSRVYHEIKEKPLFPFEQNVGLRIEVAEHFNKSRTFDKFTDRQKQEIYELLIIMSGLTYHYYEKFLREKNPEELKALKLQAAQNLKLIGITP